MHLDKRSSTLLNIPEAIGNPDDLLTTPQAAMWLGVSHQWLEIGRCKGYGPKFIKISPKIVRYRRSDVLAFLTARSCNSTAQYGAS